MNCERSALLIRMASYDVTEAIPRMASTLCEMGYSITILSLDLYGDKPDAETRNGWQILWYHHSYTPGDKFSFLWTWICWWVWVVRRICSGHYHLVQASNLESVIPCILARYFRRFKLIFDVRDPWGMCGADSRSLTMRTLKFMERAAAARVDGIVLSQGILDKTGIYFGRKVRSRIPSVQVLNVPGEDIAGQFSPPDTKTIHLNFNGYISYLRNAQAIIDIAAKMPEVQVDVSGDIRDEKLRSALGAHGNIKLYGRLPSRRDSMELFSRANLISIMSDTSTEVAFVLSSNKMFEAMMMSRPYVASEGTFAGILAQRYGVGWAIPYGDSQALIGLASRLLANPAEIEMAARRGREIYEKQFTWDRQKANLLLLYRHVAEDEKPEFYSRAGWGKMLGIAF
jgi:glycosyltransferase involved in cell wall biosynthesis